MDLYKQGIIYFLGCCKQHLFLLFLNDDFIKKIISAKMVIEAILR